MFDVITLGLLYFFTAGISLIFHLVGQWPGGIFWFWMWTGVVVIVGAWELYLYMKYRMTLTRLLTRAETDWPKVAKHKWIARAVVICYLLGAVSLCVHLWPW